MGPVRLVRTLSRAGTQGPLRPRPHHHHRADRAARERRRVHLHGAALEPGDAAPVGGHGPRHGGDRRSLRGERLQARTSPGSPRSPRTGSACRWRCCRPATCRRRSPSPSSTCSTARSPTRSARNVKRPFWIDTVGQSRHVEIRVKLDQAILRFVAPRGQAYASNSHIFLLWMVGTSVVLLTVAILFLRNQIRPILRLGEAADAFGKGRPVPLDFRPRGAREVRQAAQAFIEMRERIRHHVEQRTTMLAGVSHDLRTVLTRFKLELALLPGQPRERGAARATSTRCSTCSRTTWPSPKATAARRRRRPASASCSTRCRRRPSTWARRSRCACASPSTSWCCP